MVQLVRILLRTLFGPFQDDATVSSVSASESAADLSDAGFGCSVVRPGHGPIHFLVISGAEIGFVRDRDPEGRIRSELPPLRMLECYF